MFRRLFLILMVVGHSLGVQARSNLAPRRDKDDAFHAEIKPLLSRYCYGCHSDAKHKGGLSLEAFTDKASILKEPKTWELVMHHVQTKEMPPEDKAQPTEAERQSLISWIQKEIFDCDCDHPDPGRVTIHRLNRTEYNNTIRDLLGVDFRPADDFPTDDSGYGFDNISDALSLSPTLMEKYFRAAQEISNLAIVDHPDTNGPAQRLEAEYFSRSNDQAKNQRDGIMGLLREVEISTNFVVARGGDYLIRVRAYGQQAGKELPRMDVSLNGQSLKIFNVDALQEDPGIYKIQRHLDAGEHKVGVSYLNNFKDESLPVGERDRNLFVDFVEIVGPAGLAELPGSHKRLFPKPVTKKTDKRSYAREILTDFAERAYRRPASRDEVNRLLKFYDLGNASGENFESSVKLAIQAVLVSPHFLFRGERSSGMGGRATSRVDDFALASRLSYFLWSSMPDDRLLAEAKQHDLRKHLSSEVERLLRDKKANALIKNFVGQWLQLRQLQQSAPDGAEYPAFNESLRAAMEMETELFVAAIISEDRSILEFLDADFTFLNAPLAKLYGVDGFTGDRFQRVSLTGGVRGGLLTQASILTLTSNPNRTSPVKRGKWILENLLGAPPPPPPPDIPALNDKKDSGQTLSLRQRLEEHRKNPACASCHARMDPIGFALENFDGIGSWRTFDGQFPVDASGEFATGETINGVSDLRKYLLEKRRNEFLRCFAEKMLTYALGRGLEVSDRCAVEEILQKASKTDYRFSTIIEGIVESVPFQFRRNDALVKNH